MAIDGEPKDGDFVRYIEMLNRQAGVTPGQVPPRAARAARSKRQAELGPRDPAAMPMPVPASTSPDGPSADTGSPATLAARSSRRRVALVLTIAGVVAAWHAAGIVFDVLDSPSFEFDELVPGIFLGVCAFMLLRGGSRMRGAQRAALPSLPPLSTLPAGRKSRP
ncbi:hypothetical protein [Bordetella petrii]|uniref:hypothetical protein n=1 Tax=Bordetella petrii TaxID=94624 RepID=UPI001E5C4C26|nr:hypothetical protein [Bordetella petrii]MCD0502342.1 hypothetical protein [Bordetella petrii]